MNLVTAEKSAENINRNVQGSSLEPATTQTGHEGFLDDQRQIIVRNIRLAQMNARNDSEMSPLGCPRDLKSGNRK